MKSKNFKCLLILAALLFLLFVSNTFMCKTIYNIGYEHGYIKSLLDMQEYWQQKKDSVSQLHNTVIEH